MRESKLLKTLRTFNFSELTPLDLFLQSPYFLSDKLREEIYPLFCYLRPFGPHFNDDKLQREIAYQQLFPGEEMIKGKLEKLMSALLQQINRFIAIHFPEQKSNTLRPLLDQTAYFRFRKAYKLYEISLNKLTKTQDKLQEYGKEYFYDSFRVEKEKYWNQILHESPSESYNFSDTFRPMDAFYLLTRLEEVCFLLSIHKFRRPLEIKNAITFFDEVKPIYQKQGLLDIPFVDLYYRTFELLKMVKDDYSAYRKLKQMILENEKQIPFEGLKTLYGLSRSFIIFHYNRGATHLRDEIFSLYQDHLEKGYLNFQTGILPANFKNIVTMGLQVKAYDWVYQFLQDYKDKIEGTNYPMDIYHSNMATYYFTLKEYDKALVLLVDHYEDLFYKISAKRLELKIYYELKSEILDSKMDAFKLYIYRLPDKSILPHKRKSYNNFINFFRQLRNPKTFSNQNRIEKLKVKIKSTKYLSDKEWLLQKLEELL